MGCNKLLKKCLCNVNKCLCSIEKMYLKPKWKVFATLKKLICNISETSLFQYVFSVFQICLFNVAKTFYQCFKCVFSTLHWKNVFATLKRHICNISVTSLFQIRLFNVAKTFFNATLKRRIWNICKTFLQHWKDVFKTKDVSKMFQIRFFNVALKKHLCNIEKKRIWNVIRYNNSVVKSRHDKLFR